MRNIPIPGLLLLSSIRGDIKRSIFRLGKSALCSRTKKTGYAGYAGNAEMFIYTMADLFYISSNGVKVFAAISSYEQSCYSLG